MKSEQKPKGPWINRFATHFFTLSLAVLIFWSLGFLVQDIKSIRGPRYVEIEKQHIDSALVGKSTTLKGEITDLGRRIVSMKEDQRVVGDSSQNLQQTIQQLIELQKLSIQKGVALPDTEQSDLSTTLSKFLQSQENYQGFSTELSKLMAEKQGLEGEKRALEQSLDKQRKPARAEYNRLNRAHRLKLAALQLLILLPLLVLAAILILKKRGSIYFPLFFAFGGATLLKVTLVIHEYFPKKYFKYILIGVLLIAVARLLIHFIRVVAFPKAQWLTKQYREAYECFLCPVCEYPIRRGPRKFLYWTRRTVGKVALQREYLGEDEAYTCPACGTCLHEECPVCHKIRHALLPHCQHCGAERD
ncbi:zinc ribbon domain-containing protein [Desulfotalea psychrophila]|uniref:Conserved hypothetical membrane protein n=1 Tax=Desulfotalea psychrophila (strain LSv54 / DSM 12343) TaxID=177439 RepID=Q6AJN9_DESPS|nr:zinc ribbon domain-containing protein [Desulfotalea psychrophila]CAG37441.1 conserved hypothetical membrane protein [Desulfotalea psychrophila LSv54]